MLTNSQFKNWKSGLVLGVSLLLSTGLVLFQDRLQAVDVFVDSKVLIEDLFVLSSDKMEGRKVGTAGNKLAREYIAGRFGQIGLSFKNDTDFYRPFNEGGISGVNVVGAIEGQITNQYLVISAHFDHLGKQGDQIFSGADDNASGVSAMLAVASHFKKNKPRYSLLFLAFDSEEFGVRGSKAFVKDPSIPLNQIRLVINMDMVSQNSDNQLYVLGTQNNSKLLNILNEVRKSTLVEILFGKLQWESQSDHYSFFVKGIPYLYFGVDDHVHYHQPSDKFETIPQDFFIRSANSILKTVVAIDNLF